MTMAINASPSSRSSPSYHQVSKKLTAKKLAEWSGRFRFAMKNQWQALAAQSLQLSESSSPPSSNGPPQVVFVPRSTKQAASSGVYFGNHQLPPSQVLHPLLNEAKLVQGTPPCPSVEASKSQEGHISTADTHMTTGSKSPLPFGKPMAPAPMLGRWQQGKSASSSASQGNKNNKTTKSDGNGGHYGIHFRAPVQITQMDDYDKQKDARRRALQAQNRNSSAALVSLSPEERLFVEAATTLRRKTTSMLPPPNRKTHNNTTLKQNSASSTHKALPPPPRIAFSAFAA